VIGPAAVDASRAGRALQGRPANGVRLENRHADAALKAKWLWLLETLPEPERQELLDYARFKVNRKRGTAVRSP